MNNDRPTLSLILPAYNEAERLPPYLASIRAYLDRRYDGRHEVIVVDDGSSDGLAEVLERSSPTGRSSAPAMRRTKARAPPSARDPRVRGTGCFFADADGATPIEEECQLADGDRRRRRRGDRLAAWRAAAAPAVPHVAAGTGRAMSPRWPRLLRLASATPVRLQDVSRRGRPAAVYSRPGKRATSSTWKCWPWPSDSATRSPRCRSAGRKLPVAIFICPATSADRPRSLAAAATTESGRVDSGAASRFSTSGAIRRSASGSRRSRRRHRPMTAAACRCPAWPSSCRMVWPVETLAGGVVGGPNDRGPLA